VADTPPVHGQQTGELAELSQAAVAAPASEGFASEHAVFVMTNSVFGPHLVLTDRVPSDGSEPNAGAQHGKLVYVLN